MAHEREHRLDDRALAGVTDALERAAVEFDIPGKQTRTELIDRIAAMYAARPPARGHAGPGRTSAIAPRLSFHDFQALALRDVLSRLEQRRALRDETIAAADVRVARRVAAQMNEGSRVGSGARATPQGVGMWRAAERRAVTLYRRARDTGAVSLRNPEVDAALVAIGSGTPLPRHVCQLMEPIFGMRLDRVRIHTGAVAEQACEAVNAEAFTVGEDIFFPSYDPSSAKCRELLAHELMHCVQWWQGRIGPSAKCAVSRPSDALEQEADQFARSIHFRLARAECSRPHSGSSSRPQAHAHSRDKESTTGAVSPAPASLPLPTPRAPGIQLVMRSAKDRYGRHESVPRHVEEPEESQWRTLTQRNLRRLRDFDSSMAVWKSLPRLVREQVKEMVFWLTVFVLPVLLVTRSKGGKTLKAMLESEIGRWLGIGIPLTSASVHLGKWFDAAWDADGDAAMVKVAQDEFAAMCVALATLRLQFQFRFPKGSSPEATSNLPALSTKQGSLIPLGSNAANGAVSLSETTTLQASPKQNPEIGSDEWLTAHPISFGSQKLDVQAAETQLQSYLSQYFNAPTKDARAALIQNLDQLLSSIDISPSLRKQLPDLSDSQLRTWLGRNNALEHLASSDIRLRTQAEGVTQAFVDGLLVPGDYEFYLSRVKTVSRLREVTVLVPFASGQGDESVVFTGNLGNQRVFVKLPRRPKDHHLVESDKKVVKDLESYMGPNWHEPVAVMDSKLGFLREGIAMTLADGLSVAKLKDLKRKKLDLPYPITPDHVGAIKQLQDGLAQSRRFLLDAHGGQVILLKGPPWVMTVDMPVVEDSPQVDHDVGRLDSVLDSVIALEKYSRRTAGAAAGRKSLVPARSQLTASEDTIPAMAGGAPTGDIHAIRSTLERYFSDYDSTIHNLSVSDGRAKVKLVSDVQRQLSELGIFGADLKSLNAFDLRSLVTSKKFLKGILSPDPLHSVVKALVEAYTTGRRPRWVYEFHLRIAEQVAELPEATELTPLERGGVHAIHFQGKVGGQDAFVKMPRGHHQREQVKKELQVASDWVSRGKIRWCQLVRAFDSKLGIWREAVATELVDGLSIEMLTNLMRGGHKLPFVVTERHLEGVEAWRKELEVENVSVIGEHPGNLLATPDPRRAIVPVDIEIVPGVRYARPKQDDVVDQLRALIEYSAGQEDRP